MAFNCIIHRSCCLFIYLYLLTNHWGLCCWNPSWSFSLLRKRFFFFNFVYRSYNVFPGTSKTLKNGGFFSCLSSIVIVVFFFTYSSYKIWVCRIKLFPPFFKHSKFEQVEVERAYYFTLTIECWYVLKIWVHP